MKVPSPEQRREDIALLAQKESLQQQTIKTTTFNLYGYHAPLQNCSDIHLYIEGDGLSWVSRNRISKDPTPIQPTGFALMLKDPKPCKMYIARPCQYVANAMCEKKYWTSHRFSSEVIESFSQALDTIKKENNTQTFTLIGYSGGGAVAALLAAKRDDISRLVTVAGNVDTQKWTDLHHITPLDGSLNPAEFTPKLEKIEQYHLVGTRDETVPFSVFESYRSRFSDTTHLHVIMIDSDHHDNIVGAYEAIWDQK